MNEHTIGYAYPSSPRAARLGRASTGTYSYQRGEHGRVVPFDTYAEALANAVREGTQPARWSMDHPACTTAHLQP